MIRSAAVGVDTSNGRLVECCQGALQRRHDAFAEVNALPCPGIGGGANEAWRDVLSISHRGATLSNTDHNEV